RKGNDAEIGALQWNPNRLAELLGLEFPCLIGQQHHESEVAQALRHLRRVRTTLRNQMPVGDCRAAEEVEQLIRLTKWRRHKGERQPDDHGNASKGCDASAFGHGVRPFLRTFLYQRERK